MVIAISSRSISSMLNPELTTLLVRCRIASCHDSARVSLDLSINYNNFPAHNCIDRTQSANLTSSLWGKDGERPINSFYQAHHANGKALL
jgi:hypothetical protein